MIFTQKSPHALPFFIGLFAFTAAFLLVPSHLAAQSIVVMVNDEPITSYDVAQRQRFLALTAGLGDRMRATMKSKDTQQAFRAYMNENRPQSKQEAQELQKKFVQKVQRNVIANATQSKRQEAVDQLVEERLMIQAARERKISIDENQLNQALTKMAQSGGQDQTLEAFLGAFKAQGVNPITLKERIRSQLAWAQLIRQLYGPLVQSTLSSVGSTRSSGNGGTVVDVHIVKLSAAAEDQKALATRLVEAEDIRRGFSSCSKLSSQVGGRDGVSIQTVEKARLQDFSGDMRAAISKASEGDMTPPLVKGNSIETVAVCSKTVLASKKKEQKQAPSRSDERQEKMQLYAQRHLKDLKARAHLKYPKNG